jgi:hypothetical protein
MINMINILKFSPFYYVPFDCTHWCFPSGADRYMLLMLYNTLFRRVDVTQWKVLNQENLTEDKLKGTGLMEGDLVKSSRQREIYLIQNGQKRLFNSWDAFAGRGYSLDKVKMIDETMLNKIEIGSLLE